jgi:hypothetical protein
MDQAPRQHHQRDLFEFTGLAAAITSMATNLTGTPNDGDGTGIHRSHKGLTTSPGAKLPRNSCQQLGEIDLGSTAGS